MGKKKKRNPAAREKAALLSTRISTKPTYFIFVVQSQKETGAVDTDGARDVANHCTAGGV